MKRSQKLSRQVRGFTLLEMIVALAVLAIVAASVFEGLRFGQRSYSQVIRRGAASWDMYTSARIIRDLIENAYPLEPAAGVRFGVEGKSDSLIVSAPSRMAQADAGLYRYEIVLKPRATRGQDLVVRFRPDLGRDPDDEPHAGTEEVLLENVASIAWSFRGRTSVEQGVTPVWSDGWHEQALPTRVRVRVQFAPDDPRHWPELIAVPRITDDANCEFDVVSQSCRGSS